MQNFNKPIIRHEESIKNQIKVGVQEIIQKVSIDKEVAKYSNQVMRNISANITTVASEEDIDEANRVSSSLQTDTEMQLSDGSDKISQPTSFQNEFIANENLENLDLIASSSNLPSTNSIQKQSGRARSDSPIELSSDSDSDNSGYSKNNGTMKLKSLILEFPKNAPMQFLDKITKVRQEQRFDETQNQIEETVDGQRYQLILKDWLYNSEISVIKNIGFILRHYYLTDSLEEEISERTKWKLFVANDEGENIPIINRKGAIKQIQSETVVVMRTQMHPPEVARPGKITAKKLFKKPNATRDSDSDFTIDTIKKKGIQKKLRIPRKDLKKQQLKNKIQKFANKPEDYKNQLSEGEDYPEVIDVTKATDGLFNPPVFPKQMVQIPEKVQITEEVKECTKEKKLKEKKSKFGPPTSFSSCKNFAINPANAEYFIHPPAIDFLASIKSEIFKTRQDFDQKVIQKLNSFSPVCQYKVHETTKYIQIKCSCCKLFSFWFKNVNDKPVQDLTITGNQNLNLIYFRSINQNHVRTGHCSIDFN